ncbi:hypothetical protein ACA910_008238 [Epithemia clementina (nom. ined.)]
MVQQKNSPHSVNFVSEDEGGYDDESAVGSADHVGFARRTVDEIRDLQKLVCFETNSLRCWRLIVVLLLLITGATIATFTFIFLRGEEEESFERTYNLFAVRTKATSEEYMQNLVLSFEEFSGLITNAALLSSATFPLVTVPNFEVLGYHARVVTGVEMVMFTPIVNAKNVDDWNKYSVENKGWIKAGRDYLRSLPENEDPVLGIGDEESTDISPYIWRLDALENPVAASPPPHVPVWQTSPPPQHAVFVNYDSLTEPVFGSAFHSALIVKEAVFSGFIGLSRYNGSLIDGYQHQKFHEEAFKNVREGEESFAYPHSLLIQPVYEKLKDTSSPIVGVIQCNLPWDHLIQALVTEGASGIFVVLYNTCGQSYTYRLDKDKATLFGEGDLHDTRWDSKKVVVPLTSYLRNATTSDDGHCIYSMNIYPSDSMRNDWESSIPLYFAYAVAGTFFAITVTFFIYDGFVRRRNKVVVQAAARSNKIVASLFPSNVRDRLLAEEEGAGFQRHGEQGTQTRLKNFLANDAPSALDLEETDDLMFKTKPIADLFPETTILFADIAGFTAWSSAREPSQVFTLLETVYRAFDVSAQRRRIFKVETVGDCYVAATGIPEPRKDHAVAMARFAKECMSKMQALTRRLEVSLGPDTADLAMRMGMHSGPVTAGVLRGERSRFQLFGDTMNTASRMESTGLRDHIQISQETADLLRAAGKGEWIVPRRDIVVAKGKGELKTYWLEVASHEGASVTSGEGSDGESIVEMELQAQNQGFNEEEEVIFSDKAMRLIDWNVDLLLRLLQLTVARRMAHPPVGQKPNEQAIGRDKKRTVLDEVSEVIVLPDYDDLAYAADPKSVILDPDVELQLYEYVTSVAGMYRKNPFHNFEHASHVTMSVAKLLSRIVAPSHMDFQDSIARDQTLHDHTYGITSDPLTQFACVFSALIHDVDHTGVPNTQLVKENLSIASLYKSRSVAEQNSVDVAWTLLMQDEFSALRTAIYTTDEELKRFRQLVVNCVMATDIMDKELKELRNARWDRAFSEQAVLDDRMTINRKATIVIEHLLQASDVAHTMQHWHIYRKWNAKLFEEMYKAYKEGRAEKNPADFWYKGEIGFFDFYIIPLAKKLKECGVFGVSSKEYLNYAERNRKEWELRGQEVLSELIENVNRIYDPPRNPPLQESAPERWPGGPPRDITIQETPN